MGTRNDAAVGEILTEARSLRDRIAQIAGRFPDVTELGVRVAGGPGTSQGATSTARLIIRIEADTQAHAEQHAAELEAQGGVCTSTGPTSVECEFESDEHE